MRECLREREREREREEKCMINSGIADCMRESYIFQDEIGLK